MGVGVAVGVAVGVLVGVAVGVAVGVLVGVAVAVGNGVALGAGVGVGVLVGVAVLVGTAVFVGAGVAVGNGVALGTGVGVGADAGAQADNIKLTSKNTSNVRFILRVLLWRSSRPTVSITRRAAAGNPPSPADYPKARGSAAGTRASAVGLMQCWAAFCCITM